MKSAEDIVTRYKEAYNLRETRKTQWAKSLYHCIPSERHLVYDDVRAERSFVLHPMNSIGIDSAIAMASGIYSYMIANTQRLFGLRTSNPEANKNDEVKEYLSEKSRITLQYIQNSNFSGVIFDNILHGLGVVGTDSFLQEWDKEDEKLKYIPVRAWDCCIVENKYREVDGFYFRWKLTARQSVGRFGYNKCSDDVKLSFDTPGNELQETAYIYAVHPRNSYKNNGKKKTKKNKKYSVCWVDEKAKEIVKEDGFDVFPLHVARGFLTSDSPYGRSRAEDALPALSKIDRGERMIDDQAEMDIKKPIWMPSSAGDGRRIRIAPGAINYYNPVSGADIPKSFETGDQPEAMINRVENATKMVKDMFFVELFRVLADQVNMTAEEVRERIMESIQGVSPVVTEYEKTTLTTTILHAMYLLEGAGKFSHLVAPPELNGHREVIHFTTRLDFKLREIDTDQLLKTVREAMELYKAQAEAPGINNIINIDKAIRDTAYSNGVDPDIVYTEIEAKKLRQAEKAENEKQMLIEASLDKVGEVDPMIKPQTGSLAESMQGQGASALLPQQ